MTAFAETRSALPYLRGRCHP